MAGQVPGGRYCDLPVPALVQVGGADVRMVENGTAVRKRINVIGHRETSCLVHLGNS